MRPIWNIKNLYNFNLLRRRWIYGLASVTLVGSGGSFFLLSPCSDYTQTKVKKWVDLFSTLSEPLSSLIAVVDFEDWLLFDATTVSQETSPTLEQHWLFETEKQWILLGLTKSAFFSLRQIGVKAISEAKFEDYRIRSIAQACEPRTSVSLARTPGTSDLYFLPPPKLHDFCKEGILEELRRQLSLLPVPSAESTISHFKAEALDEEISFQDILSLDLDGPLYTIPGEKEGKEEHSLLFCLQAIQEYTAVAEYSVKFVENQGLSVLQLLLQESSETWVHVYVASILANLSLQKSLMEFIVQTGWLYTLRQWAGSDDATLSLLALTTLANLDQDWIDKSLYHGLILIHPTLRTWKPAKMDIVFVHGLRGGPVITWRQQDGAEGEQISQCWPRDWLAADCEDIRIVSIGYESCLSQWGDYCPVEQDKRTIEGRASDLIRKLQQAGVGSRPIIWVGHSMGGLLIKEILALSEEGTESSDLRCKTRGLVMYSVPHRGSSIADTAMYGKYLFYPSVEVQELITSSPNLATIHDKFLEFVTSKGVPILSFGETLKTGYANNLLDILVVPPMSSDIGVGKYLDLPVNHINSCKPASQSDPMYQETLEFIKKIVKS